MFLKRKILKRIHLFIPNSSEKFKTTLGKIHILMIGILRVSDKVAVRDYTTANSKWKFCRIISRDGELYHTVKVYGNLVWRHVEQF